MLLGTLTVNVQNQTRFIYKHHHDFHHCCTGQKLEAQTGTSLAPVCLQFAAEPLLVCEDQSLLFVSQVPHQKNHHTSPVLTITDI